MTRSVSRLFFVAVALIAGTRAGSAQTVSELLRFLVTNQSIVTGSIERDEAAAQSTSEAISRALLANLSTLPITASSSAFIYSLNPVLGTVERTTRSFGPLFVERALPAGRRGASVGMSYQHLRFTALDGRNLRDGSMFTTANRFIDEDVPFDVDRLTLDLNVALATLYGNLGLTDRLEVGVALPMMALRLQGSRVNTYRGETFTQASASSTALGFADLVVRAKYSLFERSGTGWATALDARLPTGREEDLLGTGSTSFRVSAIGSHERERFSTHANVGVTMGGSARDVTYGGAVTVAAHNRLTVNCEILGRWMSGIGRIEAVSAPHPRLSNVETLRLRSTDSGLHIMGLSPGFKWNLTDTWLVVGNVTVPLTDGGLTTRFTPFIGVDYALER